jgi:penicillin amidase
MEDILAGSLGQMLAELRGAMGNHMAQWTWGKIHSLTFEHVLGKKRPLDRVFNLGPFPVGGSHLTVNKKQYPYEEPYHAKSGVAQRMIVDLSDVGRSLRVLPTGESGNLASPHHNDQIDLYLNGGYHTAWMDRGEVEKQATATLILRPSRNQ